ncbi:MAG: DNA-3-methyladenine glycosylase 2 family protein [Erysipelotrichaceae bacterium]|nr:DNA-3-methyladenine glycosylase 2 family protein [Erysipelotrichaceae bacterium]
MRKTIRTDDPEAVYLKRKDKRLAKVIDMIGDLKIYQETDGYSFLVEGIVGQMLSNKVAEVLCGRLHVLCEGDIDPEKIKKLSIADLKSIGISAAKAQYIMNLTEAVDSDSIDLNTYQSMSDDEALKSLTAVKGIGTWTAKMYLIFVLNREDVLPYEDVAFLQSYKWLYKTDDVSRDAVKKKCRKWRPYSSLAARYLYRALDEGLTAEEFHLYK